MKNSQPRALLDAPSAAVLAVYRAAGTVLITPVWFRAVDEWIEVVIAEGDAKLERLRVDPRCVFMAFETVPPFAGPGERSGDQFTKPFAISGLAAIATDRREFERAATLVGAAEAIMEAHQMAWPPDERPHYERMLAVLPEALGSVEFERARARGNSMTSGEAVEFALGARSAGG